MCTCSNYGFSKGNPYHGCHECNYDSDCSSSWVDPVSIPLIS